MYIALSDLSLNVREDLMSRIYLFNNTVLTIKSRAKKIKLLVFILVTKILLIKFNNWGYK